MELSTIQKIENLAKDFQDFTANFMKERYFRGLKQHFDRHQNQMNSFNDRLEEICKSFNTNTTKIGKYDVDKSNKTCSCPHFQYRLKGYNTLCKHLEEALRV